MRDSNLNRGTARERERAGTHCGPFAEQRKNRVIPEKASRRQTGPRQEAGGRGKGQTRPQRRHPYQTANRLPVSNQRLPEILDGRHPPGGSWLEASS